MRKREQSRKGLGRRIHFLDKGKLLHKVSPVLSQCVAHINTIKRIAESAWISWEQVTQDYASGISTEKQNAILGWWMLPEGKKADTLCLDNCKGEVNSLAWELRIGAWKSSQEGGGTGFQFLKTITTRKTTKHLDNWKGIQKNLD